MTRLLSVLAAILIAACGQRPSEKIIIAAAANMQFALEEIIETFEEDTGIECESIISSSGKLTAQIMEGAPFDVFISADMKFPEELFKNGVTLGEPEIYAFGNLVIWSINDTIVPEISHLTKDSVNHVALANPKTAPYGLAAMEVLDHHNLGDSLKNKLVYGESVAQTNQFIISGSAEIGFTAKSVVLSSQMKGHGLWADVDPDFYSPIAQGVVIINHQNNKMEDSQMFYEFLFSEKSKKILNKFGYTVKAE